MQRSRPFTPQRMAGLGFIAVVMSVIAFTYYVFVGLTWGPSLACAFEQSNKIQTVKNTVQKGISQVSGRSLKEEVGEKAETEVEMSHLHTSFTSLIYLGFFQFFFLINGFFKFSNFYNFQKTKQIFVSRHLQNFLFLQIQTFSKSKKMKKQPRIRRGLRIHTPVPTVCFVSVHLDDRVPHFVCEFVDHVLSGFFLFNY